MPLFRFRSIVEDFEARLQPPDLHSQPKARGKVEWERFADGEVSFELNVSRLDLPDGSLLEVRLDEDTIGQISLSRGRGRLDTSTASGVSVPVVAAGMPIQISYLGTTVLAGVFAAD